MDIAALKGLIEAIGAEGRAPGPSHANMARLTSTALWKIMEHFETPVVQSNTETASENTSTVEIGPELPKKKRKKLK